MIVRRSSRRCGASSASPAGTTHVAPGRRPRDQLGLGGGDRLQRAEQLQVRRPDVDDHADVRARRSPSARRSGPAPRIAISSTSTRSRRGARGSRAAGRSRCCRLAGVATVRPVRREQRGQDVLGRGLAGRAGDRHDPARAPSSRATRGRAPAAPRSGSGCGEHGARGAGMRPRRACARRDEHPPGAGAQRLRGELAAVDALARQPDEQLAAADARASRSPRARAGPRRVAPAPRGQQRCARDRATRRTALRPARAAARAAPRARPSTSSNGSLRPPANSWPCSWPLPAITTTSPGRAASIAAAIAAAVGRATRASRARAPARAPGEDLVDDRARGPRSAGCRR